TPRARGATGSSARPDLDLIEILRDLIGEIHREVFRDSMRNPSSGTVSFPDCLALSSGNAVHCCFYEMDPSAYETSVLGDAAARIGLCVVRLHVEFKSVWAISVLADIEKL